MKFSALALAAVATFAAVSQAKQALDAAGAADDAAHDDVVAALKLQTPPKAALADESGAIAVYTLDTTGSSYVVETIAGDFDVPDAAPVDPPADHAPVDDQAVS